MANEKVYIHEFNHDSLQNPTPAECWSVAAKLRRHGDDRTTVRAILTWEEWAIFEAARHKDAALVKLRASIRELAVDWHRWLLLDSPLSPHRTARQPLESDRMPLQEIV